MKKSLKTTLVASGLLALTGLICMLVAFCFSGFGLKSMIDGESETQTVIIENSEDIKNIILNQSCFDLEICLAGDGVFRIENPSVNNLSFDYYLDEDGVTLKNNVTDERKWYEYISLFFNRSEKVTKIYIPQKQYETLNLDCGESDVAVKYNLSFENCEITTTSGDIDYSVVDAQRVKLTTQSGDMRFTHVVHGEASLQTESGDVYISSASDVTVDANTLSGDVSVENASFKRLSVKTESGDITVDKISASEQWMGLNTNSGDINARDVRSEKIYFTTVSGDVDGTIATPARFEVDNAQGETDIIGDHKNSDVLCSVKTQSGDIHIKAAE